jgi:hypothetical protein
MWAVMLAVHDAVLAPNAVSDSVVRKEELVDVSVVVM